MCPERRASVIDRIYWWYVKRSLNYERVLQQNEPLQNPEWAIIMLIGNCCNSHARLEMMELAKAIEKLDIGSSIDRLDPRESEYITHMRRQYMTIVMLFVFGFYYEALDSCRKMVELLYRRELNIKLNEDLRMNKKVREKVDWDEENELYELYSELCKSVHGQFPEVWKKSSKLSPFYNPSSKKDAAGIPSEIRDSFDRLSLSVQGIEGLPEYSFNKINETIKKVNSIVKKYPLSKPEIS